MLTQSLLPLALISLVCSYYRGNMELLNIAMLYLLPILFTASRHGQKLTFLVSIIAVILFDILFIPPFFELSVHNAEYMLSFVIMIFVGQFVSILSQKAAKTKELETSEKLYEAVLGSLSHELRTPLTVVVGATSGLLSKELNLSEDERLELCQDACNSAIVMQELVENLLAGARVESGGFRPKIATCSIGEIVSNALLKAEKKHLRQANFILSDDLPPINSDAVLLEQAFYNLIDNAFKYGDDVKVVVSSSLKDLFVKICNNGKIPNENELNMMGEKFSRLSNSQSSSGIGLGVYLSKRLIEILHGDIHMSINESFFCISVRMG